MKKSNNKGFMLAETLIVSTLVVTVLIYIYMQFMNIYNSYQNSFDYNTVDGLYGASNIRSFLLTDNIDNIVNNNNLINNYYVDLKTYNGYQSVAYATKMYDFLGVNEIILTNDNTNDLKNNIGTLNFSIGLKDFINSTKSTGEASVYRLFISYNNNTYASIKLYVEG